MSLRGAHAESPISYVAAEKLEFRHRNAKNKIFSRALIFGYHKKHTLCLRYSLILDHNTIHPNLDNQEKSRFAGWTAAVPAFQNRRRQGCF